MVLLSFLKQLFVFSWFYRFSLIPFYICLHLYISFYISLYLCISLSIYIPLYLSTSLYIYIHLFILSLWNPSIHWFPCLEGSQDSLLPYKQMAQRTGKDVHPYIYIYICMPQGGSAELGLCPRSEAVLSEARWRRDLAQDLQNTTTKMKHS